MKTKLKFPEEEYIDYDIPCEDMDVDIRNYHSKAVKVRKDCRCNYCGYPIKKGEYALAFSVIYENEFCYGHYCMGCVEDNISMDKGKIDNDVLFKRYEKRVEASKKLENLANTLVDINA